MSSLIAIKLNTNMWLVSIKLSLLSSLILCGTVQTCTTYTTIITRSLFLSAYNFLQATLVRYSSDTTIRYSAHNLVVSANLYLLDLYIEELQTHNFAQS